MHMRLFSEQRADVGLVRVAGEIDLATAAEFRDALLQTIASSRAIEADLRGVTFIDCVGLRALREAELIATRRGCHFVLRRSRAVQRLERLIDEARTEPMGGSTHGGLLCRPRSWTS